MDTRTLELVVGLYEEPVILDTSSDNSDEVARIYTTGDDDFDESDRIPFGEELVRRFNEYPQQAERIAKLEEALKNAVDCIEIGADDSEEAGYPSRAESMREDASAYRAILQTIKP